MHQVLLLTYGVVSAGAVSRPLPSQAPNDVRAGVVPTAPVHFDTGDFAPKRTLLAHHNTPHLCLAAVRTVEWEERRTYAEQIADIRQHEAPLTDTLPTRATAVARECLAQFAKRNVPPYDLRDLFRLALSAGEDTLAHTIADRWIASRSTPGERDALLVLIDSLYLTARPSRAAAAALLFDRVTSNGPTRAETRLRLARQLLQFWTDVYDPARMRQWSDQVLSVLENAPEHPLYAGDWSVVEAFRARNKIAYAQNLDSAGALAEQARQVWAKIPRDTLANVLPWNPTTASIENIQQLLSPIDAGAGVAVNALYPPLTAPYWFPAKPEPGTVTLVVTPSFPCFIDDVALLALPTQLCMPTYERIRRLAARYTLRELRIVVLLGTQGNAIRSLPLTPEKEVEALRSYLLDYLKLPVTVAIVERPVHQLPAPDLRRWPKAVCNESLGPYYGNDSSVVACRYLAHPLVLLGRRGELIYAGEPSPLFDVVLGRTLGSAIATDGTHEEH